MKVCQKTPCIIIINNDSATIFLQKSQAQKQNIKTHLRHDRRHDSRLRKRRRQLRQRHSRRRYDPSDRRRHRHRHRDRQLRNVRHDGRRRLPQLRQAERDRVARDRVHGLDLRSGGRRGHGGGGRHHAGAGRRAHERVGRRDGAADAKVLAAEVEEVHAGDGLVRRLRRFVLDEAVALVLVGGGALRQFAVDYRAERLEYTENER